MDKLASYRKHIEAILTRYGSYKPSYGDVEVQLVFDRERDRYLVLSVGWKGDRRVRGCVLHVDIQNGKIWIQHDGTEGGIANELVELGVPKQDIVLAFHVPYRRQFTDFAVS